jgi:two-component system alkaline phosphatase synthesis response regulator PhoP
MALEDDLRGEGYDVELVSDGDAARQRAVQEHFDAIVLDVMLPRKDGLDVCRDVRRAGIRTPILLLTAKTQEADKVLGLETGADDYVTKPYSARELRARIKALLRRSADMRPQVYCFDDIEIDFTRRELSKGGRVVPLTPLEFKLLDVFVRQRGRALSRQQLIDEAWGCGTFVTDRVVDNQIVNLRKKIEPNPSRPRYVFSVRGFGYRFDVAQP